MEGFLEASRIAEVSLTKLNSRRNGDLPLRRTLLVSQVLTKAQTVATSAHTCLLNSPPELTSERCTSKLLASFGQNPDLIDGLPVSSSRAALPGTVTRPKSHISLQPSTHPHCQMEEEPMDFENVSSVLNCILCDTEFEDSSFIAHQLTGGSSKAVEQSKNYWSESNGTGTGWQDSLTEPTRPVSPGKRNYHEAFPLTTQGNGEPYDQFEDSKRFKSSTAEDLELVTGFSGYLSSKNLQTAPFLTYMFGKGFSVPSNPSSSQDWPEQYEPLATDSQGQTFPTLHSTPILAY